MNRLILTEILGSDFDIKESTLSSSYSGDIDKPAREIIRNSKIIKSFNTY